MRNEVTSAATGAACVCFKHPGQAARALETIQHQAAGVPGALKVRAKVPHACPCQAHQHLGGLGELQNLRWRPQAARLPAGADVRNTEAGCTQRELLCAWQSAPRAERCGRCMLPFAWRALPACGADLRARARAQAAWARDREHQTPCLLVGNLSGDVGEAALLGACYARGAGWGLDARIAPAPPAAVTHGFVWFACAPCSAR